MCIALWALDHQDYALILFSNRDEFLSRPTQDAHFHDFETGIESRSGNAEGNILSGRDIKAGGTWFGVTRTGRVALLGSLTSNFLLSDSLESLEDQVRRMTPQDAKFAGFNLLLFTAAPQGRADGPLHFDPLLVTNHGSGGTITSLPLSAPERLCGCVSNAVGELNKDWPKVKQAKKEFDGLLQTLCVDTKEEELTDRLFNLLADFSESWRTPESVTERSHLRKTIHVAPFGISLDVKKTGETVFIERDIWKLVDGQAVKASPESQRVFRFQIKPK
ncbi:hypothetical protein H0H81_010559 [Sphagnurus paluster]|uniref:DUF833-domain-containing protein n=1 Tax=Sphagnurus paluster TaxID=117069 RepID=A0A9P7FX66_9AGAR|nr:hypothetical protein H0H81_010559 [Sphagnurus paluster]